MPLDGDKRLVETSPNSRVRQAKLTFHLFHISADAKKLFEKCSVRLRKVDQPAAREGPVDLGATVRAAQTADDEFALACGTALRGCFHRSGVPLLATIARAFLLQSNTK
jgi:hypothetical protein